ncbi:MAG: tetratricopeptide repeat protein, partial [Acidobacteriota bacterium]|nr:tetratricopeptide repeat protein [Acidobacteriota bacterium]
AGRYKQASESYEKFLRTFPQASNRDRALFRLGLSLALAGEDQDMRQTEAAFQKLVAEFPRSPYRRQAEWILGLQTRIEKMQSDIKDRDERIRQLGDELRKLKSIDLGRRPSRPE